MSGVPITQFDDDDAIISATRPVRRNRILVGAVIAALIVVAAGGWAVAAHQDSVASKWRSDDRLAMADNQKVRTMLTGAESSITALNAQVASLDGQVKTATSQLSTTRTQLQSTQNQLGSTQTQLATTQGQLASVANQKEKAEDQNTVLDQLVSSAGQVSQKLEACVNDSNTVWSEMLNDVQNGTANDPSLSANINTVSAECSQAESANQQLQQVISSSTGQ